MKTVQRMRNDAAPRSHTRPVCHPAPAPRALVVAKDARFRRWAGGQLRGAGFEIVVADDGWDALLAVDRDPPDAIIVDHGLPWFGTICLLSRACGETEKGTIPVLLVAPRAADSLVTACRALNVAVLVMRPGEPQAAPRLSARKPRAAQRETGTECRRLSYERSG